MNQYTYPSNFENNYNINQYNIQRNTKFKHSLVNQKKKKISMKININSLRIFSKKKVFPGQAQ